MGAPFILEKELARRLGVTPHALIARRKTGTAPPHRRCDCGHAVLYTDDESLKQWIDEHQPKPQEQRAHGRRSA